jgi:hypothetical protein
VLLSNLGRKDKMSVPPSREFGSEIESNTRSGYRLVLDISHAGRSPLLSGRLGSAGVNVRGKPTDRFGDVARRQVSVMLLDHPSVAMAERLRDDH